jgi:hypothetical protein
LFRATPWTQGIFAQLDKLFLYKLGNLNASGTPGVQNLNSTEVTMGYSITPAIVLEEVLWHDGAAGAKAPQM